MKGNHIIIIILISFISCTWEADGTLPNGYPFEGGVHNLNFKVFDGNKFGSNWPQFSKAANFIRRNKIRIISRKALCDSISQMDCQACNCDEVDFNNEILVNKLDAVYHVYECTFDPKVLIDHDSKQLGIQTTRHVKSGSSELNSYYSDFYYDEWLIIPKPPLGYTLNLDY
jgi:hypothetical protein